MKKWALTAVLLIGLGSSANAATVTQFNASTNDGVRTLTAAQIAEFGVAGAQYIGFFRVREGGGTTFNAGDTFDVTTMTNSVLSGGSNILAFLNGENAGLGYTGGFYAPLGTTTLGAADSYFRGVAFLFSGDENIVFRGTSTFNAGQSTGNFSPVPIPAALPLFATGVAAVAYAGRRKRKAVQTAA